MARVLFVTDQWGYGSTTCALTVAGRLAERHHTLLAGEGAGFGVARGGPFHEYVRTDTGKPDAPAALKEAVRASDLVVSVMNPNVARLAGQVGVGCVYLDFLTWMWGAPPRLPSNVVRYFAAAFPGTEDNLRRWHDRLPEAEMVAPFIGPGRGADAGQRTEILLNFGGLSAFLMPQDALNLYARTMVECVVQALAESRWPGSITVAAGEHVLNAVDPARFHLAHDGVRFETPRHPEYLGKIDLARALVSSPGLHATAEAAARGVPTVLLPSQNVSQALTLRKLPSAGPATPLDWADLSGPTPVSAANEARSCLLIADRIRAFATDPEARRRLVSHLSGQFAPDRLQRALAPESDLFEASRAGAGAERVAAFVDDILDGADPVVGGSETAERAAPTV
jgi:hypothetical protein